MIAFIRALLFPRWRPPGHPPELPIELVPTAAKVVALLRARWSPPGELSLSGCWTCYAAGYLYIADTRRALVSQVWTEWENDRHLVG